MRDSRSEDGQFEYRPRRGELAHLVRIEADGYEVAVSREIKSTEGDVSLDFELKRANNLVAKVVTPDLKPAAGASVAIGIAGSQINVKNGGSTTARPTLPVDSTDAAGRFHFPPQDKDFQLVITHPSGYAHVKSPRTWDTARIIRLEPWARVEGTFRVGRDAGRERADQPPDPRPRLVRKGCAQHLHRPRGDDGAGRAVRVRSRDPRPREDRPRHHLHGGRRGHGGDLVVQDRGGLPRREDRPHRPRRDRPGGGRQAPAARGSRQAVRWNFAEVSARPARDEDQATGPYLTATVDREGRFRIDDVPAGSYMLSIHFHRGDMGFPGVLRFAVAPSEGPPIDLGTLKLQRR